MRENRGDKKKIQEEKERANLINWNSFPKLKVLVYFHLQSVVFMSGLLSIMCGRLILCSSLFAYL